MIMHTICSEHGSGEAIMVDLKPVCAKCLTEYGHAYVKNKIFRTKKEEENGKVIPFRKKD